MHSFLANVRQLFGSRSSHAADRSSGDIRGEGNEIIGRPEGFMIRIYGNRNRVVFGSSCAHFVGGVLIGTPDCPVSDCLFSVGEGSTCEYLTARILESGSSVVIGRDCMISSGVQIWCSDTHALVGLDGRLLNGGPHAVTVGDHSWIGGGATLLKGSVIGAGSVVGFGSVVSGSRCSAENVVVAGNPARVVREGVTWRRDRPEKFGSTVGGGLG